LITNSPTAHPSIDRTFVDEPVGAHTKKHTFSERFAFSDLFAANPVLKKRNLGLEQNLFSEDTK
jgi:hypothetical protein